MTSERYSGRPLDRRRFLKGFAAATAGLAAVQVAGFVPAARAEEEAGIQITHDEPKKGLKHQFERVGARRHGLEDRWRPTGHVWVKNSSSVDVVLASMRISYSGSNVPSPVALPVGRTIAANKTAIVPIEEDRLHGFAAAGAMQIACRFEGFREPVTVVVALEEYANSQPGGPYDFAGRTKDLPAGCYWSSGGNHGYGSNHSGTQEQRFAYDLGVARWDDAAQKWTGLRAGTDGSKAEDYLIFGAPVYAMADGVIVRGYREVEDGPIGVDNSPGGNILWIRHEAGDALSGHFALYAHLQQYSIPEALLPNGEGEPGVPVKRGQFLGLAGKSGTEKPHLHIHLQRGISLLNGVKTGHSGQGVPLLFRQIQLFGREFAPGSGHSAYAPGHPVAIPETCIVHCAAPTSPGFGSLREAVPPARDPRPAGRTIATR